MKLVDRKGGCKTKAMPLEGFGNGTIKIANFKN